MAQVFYYPRHSSPAPIIYIHYFLGTHLWYQDSITITIWTSIYDTYILQPLHSGQLFMIAVFYTQYILDIQLLSQYSIAITSRTFVCGTNSCFLKVVFNVQSVCYFVDARTDLSTMSCRSSLVPQQKSVKTSITIIRHLYLISLLTSGLNYFSFK